MSGDCPPRPQVRVADPAAVCRQKWRFGLKKRAEKNKRDRKKRGGLIPCVLPPCLLLLCLALLGIGNAYVRAQNAVDTVSLKTMVGDPELIAGIGFQQQLFNEEETLRWEMQTWYDGASGVGEVWTSDFEYCSAAYDKNIENNSIQLMMDSTYIEEIAGVEYAGEGTFYREYALADYMDTLPIRVDLAMGDIRYYGNTLFGGIDDPGEEKYPVIQMPEDAVLKVERTSAAYGATTGISYENIADSDLAGDCVRIGGSLYFTITTAVSDRLSEDVPRAEYEGHSGLYRIDVEAYEQLRKTNRLADPEIELVYSIPVSSEKPFQIVGLSLLGEETNSARMLLLAREGENLILYCFGKRGNVLSESRWNGMFPVSEDGRIPRCLDFANASGDTWFFISRDSNTGRIEAAAWAISEAGELTLLKRGIAEMPDEQDDTGYGSLVRKGAIWDAAWHNGQICLLMTRSGNERHETSAYVLVPGEGGIEYLGQFYNSMDEDRTVAATDIREYGRNDVNGARYGYGLQFLEE